MIEICNEAAKSPAQIRTATAEGFETNEEQLIAALNELTTARILYEERGKYFTLAIPENPYF